MRGTKKRMNETATTNNPELIQTQHGYYQYQPLPTDEELQDYYANKYYQEGHGSYTVNYEQDEIDYFHLKAWMIYRKTEQLLKTKKKSFIDVGCGEGWLLNQFHQYGYDVTGLDFSQEGISNFNSHILPYLKQGNIFDLLQEAIQQDKQYDVIALCNVIEHVKFPEDLLQDLKKIMHKDGLLIVNAPNDFSLLQKHLLENNYIKKEWWLGYPDHLSYFNKESMENVLQAYGYQVDSVVAENPVDLNILNDNSNYIEDKSKGRAVHFFRVRHDNFLADIDKDKLLAIYELYGSMGIGRDLVYYCRQNGSHTE